MLAAGCVVVFGTFWIASIAPFSGPSEGGAECDWTSFPAPHDSETSIDPPVWPTPNAPIRLASNEGIVRGKPLEKTGGVKTWTSEGIASSWAVAHQERAVRLASPTILGELDRAARVRLRVNPVGLEQVAVLPLIETKDSLWSQRQGREVSVPIPAESAGGADEAVELEVGFRNLATGWEDRRKKLRVTGIEVTLIGRDPKASALQQVVVNSRVADLGAVAGGRERIELNGVTRPSWHLSPGADVTLQLDLPKGTSKLRWYGGALDDATLTVSVDGNELAQVSASNRWRLHTKEVHRSQPGSIRVVLGAEGPGIGVFGAFETVSVRDEKDAPDVLVYLVDTLRADRVGAWGSASANTPTIDRLARTGFVFGNANSVSAWTMPAIPSLMTGVWPTTHQINMMGRRRLLPAGVPTLSERFSQGGWRSGSFSAHPAGTQEMALDRGFDAAYLPRHWRDEIGRLGHPDARLLHGSLLSWIEEAPERPFFAYVHTLEVHEWHQGVFGEPPSGRDLYDLSVDVADRELGRLLKRLASIRDRPLLVVFVSDHGESFGDHELQGHGSGLYRSQTHIPLIFWSSDGRIGGASPHEPVSMADIAPTLLELFGLPPLPDAQASSLVGMMKADPDRPKREFIPMALYQFFFDADAKPRYATLDRNLMKTMYWTGDDRWERYDLGTDPCERASLPSQQGFQAELLGWLDAENSNAESFTRRYPDHPGGGVHRVDDLEALKALGYLGNATK
jgi:arylsulfatase A-like enzyme